MTTVRDDVQNREYDTTIWKTKDVADVVDKIVLGEPPSLIEPFIPQLIEIAKNSLGAVTDVLGSIFGWESKPIVWTTVTMESNPEETRLIGTPQDPIFKFCFGRRNGVGWGELEEICVFVRNLDNRPDIKQTRLQFVQNMRCQKSDQLRGQLDISFSVRAIDKEGNQMFIVPVGDHDRQCGRFPVVKYKSHNGMNFNFQDIVRGQLILTYPERVHGGC